jgi:DNA-binding FadR family transcriptional regulator
MNHQDETLEIVPAHSRDDLLAQFRQAIRNGSLRPGARLPNERLVAELSGLSRSTVRVVFGLLEQEGRIVRHVGRGTYVRDTASPVPSAAEIWPAAPGTWPTPAELMEFRLTCEPPLVELAVLKSTDAQLEHLSSVAEVGRQVRSWRDAETADRRFHEAIFELTGNKLYIELGRRLSSARDSRGWLRLKEGNFSPEKWVVYQQEHETIVSALLDRNADAARQALRRHLGGVRANAQMVAWEI